jgi:hypothetical protein
METMLARYGKAILRAGAALTLAATAFITCLRASIYISYWSAYK